MIKTGNNKILLLKNDSNVISNNEFEMLIKSVKDTVPDMESPEVREFIKGFVPEYNYEG